MTKRRIQIAVVGDVHDQWDREDGEALKHLAADLVLFVGDFGNESVNIVKTIAELDLPKAVILGNHDAWYTASAWGRKKSPYDHNQEDRVQQQLELLGNTHVGYRPLDFPELRLSVVGSRPFSWGGQEWKNREFLRDRYSVNSFEESTARIVAAAQEATYPTLILLGHNGPQGLGETPESPCGKDWYPLGGDHGDPDFAAAIAQIQDSGKTISLVTFGHMHHHLRHTQERQRQTVCVSPEGTVYLNSAQVPRIIEQDGQQLRNFSWVVLEEGKVCEISLVWVTSTFSIASKEVFYSNRTVQE